MENPMKLIVLGVFALVMTVLSVASATASPYDGVNRIGTYYQETRSWQMPSQSYSYGSYGQGYGNGNFYDYVAPARAGGFYGTTSGWLVGLRTPVYTPVPPVHYTNYYAPTYGYPQWFNGGYGYPLQQASSFPQYRSRVGGAMGY
jgi:hypothetical protein